MLQCTAVRHLIARETLAHVLTTDHQQADIKRFVTGYALCELGDEHDGDHAEMLCDDNDPHEATWFLWNETTHRFTTLAWCTAQSVDGDGCGLYDGHPPDHSWNVTDPSAEALTAEIAEHPERWDLPPHLL